jgi:hypothetical protein
VLAAVNMPVGEKRAYAICLLHILMCIHNVWPFLSLYDINCRWRSHFRQFVSHISGWPAELQAWALAMHMPLPPFHINMHSAECAEENSLKRIAGAGRGNGEPTEIFNRFLGLSGAVLQYAAKAVRETWLEVQMLEWTRKKEADLPGLLVRMLLRARVEEAVYVQQMQQLEAEARRHFSEEWVSPHKYFCAVHGFLELSGYVPASSFPCITWRSGNTEDGTACISAATSPL